MPRQKTYGQRGRFLFLRMLVGPIIIAILCAGFYWLQHHGGNR